MVAIIVASGRAPELHGLDEYTPLPLIPLCDRPFLQHIIEHLLHGGILQFEVILSHLPGAVEAYFGDGARWGCRIAYHLMPSELYPFRMVRRLAESIHDSVLLGRGDLLPHLRLPTLSLDQPVFFCREPAGPAPAGPAKDRWSGWAFLPVGGWRSTFLESLTSVPTLPDSTEIQYVIPDGELSIQSGEDLLRSQRQVLEHRFPDISIGGREVEPGIWISRSISIHPTAKLEAPLYIGANCRIGRDAQIGPASVVGKNCIVGANSRVMNSMVCPGTYVGEALELDHVIADKNRLVSVKIGASFAAGDAFLLSSLTDQRLKSVLRTKLDQLLAALLLLLLGPLFGLLALVLGGLRRGTLVWQSVVQLPTASDPANWRRYRLAHFEWTRGRVHSRWARLVFEFTPGLVAVVRGHLSLVGVKARAAEAIEQLPDDWKALYLNTKAGLITKAERAPGADLTDDELYSSEAHYGATENFSQDLRLLGRYLSNFTQQAQPVEESEPRERR